MESQEAALRFLCFYHYYDKSGDPVAFYSGNMEDTLDNAVEYFNDYEGLADILPVYEQVMKDAYRLFGSQTFRKVYEGQTRRSPVNKLLMLVVSVLLAIYGQEYRTIIDGGKNLTGELETLMKEDESLFNALTWSTNSKWNIDYVFRTLKRDLFDKNLL